MYRLPNLKSHGLDVLSQLGYQAVSVAGAVMVLIAYATLQQGILTREDRWFNLLNFVGAALLGWIAVVDRRWGFILLEVAWALLSLPPLLRGKRSPESKRG